MATDKHLAETSHIQIWFLEMYTRSYVNSEYVVLRTRLKTEGRKNLICSSFCKETLLISRCAANKVAKFDLLRDGTGGNVLYMTAKSWLGILRMAGG